MKDGEKVTIVIPYFDGKEEYLQKAIRSALDTRYGNKEIAVVNDGGCDISSLINGFGATNLVMHKTNNIGSAMARDYAIRIHNSNGGFYIPLDADDTIHPEFINTTISKIGDGAFCYVNTMYRWCDNNGTVTKEQVISSPDYNFFKLVLGNYISYCSLFSAKDYFEVGGYDQDNFCYYEDYQLYVKLGSVGKYGIHCGVADPLFFYRVHGESSFQSGRNKVLGNLYRYGIVLKYPEVHPEEWIETAKKEVEKYPEGFLSISPKEQEKYLKEKGLL